VKTCGPSNAIIPPPNVVTNLVFIEGQGTSKESRESTKCLGNTLTSAPVSNKRVAGWYAIITGM
jgi:hypothetical protein